MNNIDKPTFDKDLQNLINRYCKENESNTPDFILAEYVRSCLNAFNTAINIREMWYGRIDCDGLTLQCPKTNENYEKIGKLLDKNDHKLI